MRARMMFGDSEHECGTLADGVFMCGRCVEDLRALLRYGLALYAELDATVQRLDRTALKPNGSSGGRTSAPLPYRPDASVLRTHLRALLLRGWSKDESTWAGDPTGPDYLAALRKAVSSAVRRVDTQPDRVLYGMCDKCGQPVRSRPGRRWAVCGCEDTYYDTEDVRDSQLAQAWEQYAPPPVIVKALRKYGVDIRLKSVQNWIARGHLTPSDESVKKGRPEYCIADVFEVFERMRLKRLEEQQAKQERKK